MKFGKNIKKIGNSAFHGCSELKVIKSGDGVKEIGASAFEGCSSLKKISFGKKIEKIGKNAFWGCKSLEKINFGDHLKKIGARAFLNCKKITNLYIGKSLKNIGKNAFYGCYKLKKMKIHPKNKYFVMEGNVLLNKKKTKIYFGMFSSNTTCKIGANVKDMYFSIIENEKIERFEVNSSNKKFYSEDGLLYSKDGKKLYLCPRGKKGTVVISEKAEEMNEEVSIFGVPQFEDCEG